MPIFLESPQLPLSLEKINELWNAVRLACAYPDKNVTVICVSEDEIQTLNRDHRQKDKPTNVLTFSYGEIPHEQQLVGLQDEDPLADHDIFYVLVWHIERLCNNTSKSLIMLRCSWFMRFSMLLDLIMSFQLLKLNTQVTWRYQF